ncbi:McrB family protein [Aequorivita capsosiphonis]|uniref:McrB family protein n=1 Tax=Aequorivita capsosiphonis TaxID=487317 RepID=UPI000414C3F5|nr:AAA family ATPase [Aequorivita capsosiphonis]
MIDYKEYEKQVYSWLQEKHTNDPSFTFSVRMKGSKGAESDYFVGTKRSNYFATTLWTIPVSFPGSSGDAISIIFGSKDNYFGYNFEFNQTKSPHDDQNKWALELISLIKDSAIKKKLNFSYDSPDHNKMLNFKIAPRQNSYTSIDAMLEDIDKDLEIIMPIVDSAIQEIKRKNPEFVSHRITLSEFNRMQSNLGKRFSKYNNINISDDEPKIISHNIASNNELPNDKNRKPLNQILYGPPGTGKTFETVSLAVKIINPDFYNANKGNRKSIKEEYDRLLINNWSEGGGQIAFCTFHQSFSYEDFVEGIKPEIINEKDIIYVVQKGIFRSICDKSRTGSIKSGDFDAIVTRLKNDILDNGPITLTTDRGNKFDVNYTGQTTFRIRPHESNVENPQYPAAIENIRMLYEGAPLTDLYNPSYVKGILEHLYRNYHLPKFSEIKNNDKPYVFIIDEINRGNVSGIFGELITLIEPDKRTGAEEALEVMLPYSKQKFGVPKNLYIIATMNTADRSVEALDSALRRRFSFKEIMPEPSLLTDIEFDEFNLEEVLLTINERIKFLLDRDHTIGHSYFMNVESGDTLALEEVFKNKVIPLLQEYFYHDYEKIALILGAGFVTVKTNHVIKFPSFDGINEPDNVTLCELVKDIDDIEEAVSLLLNRNAQ